MGLFKKLPLLSRWPVIKQIAHGDATALGFTARSKRTEALEPRTRSACTEGEPA